jgi:hypothetical protein
MKIDILLNNGRINPLGGGGEDCFYELPRHRALDSSIIDSAGGERSKQKSPSTARPGRGLFQPTSVGPDGIGCWVSIVVESSLLECVPGRDFRQRRRGFLRQRRYSLFGRNAPWGKHTTYSACGLAWTICAEGGYDGVGPFYSGKEESKISTHSRPDFHKEGGRLALKARMDPVRGLRQVSKSR